jgi:hypothetical protein
MEKEYINLQKTENTDTVKKLFNLNENSFNKYNSEFKIVSIKTIKESCKFLISLLDKDTSTYKKDVKKIEDMEVILINSIALNKKDFKNKNKLITQKLK